MSFNARKRIKIMQVTRSLNVGGLEKLVSNLARGLDPGLFDVSVVCLLRTGFFYDELEKEGVKVHLVAQSEADVKSRFLFLKLAKLFRQEKPDIVHTHNTHPLIDGVMAAKLAGVSRHVHTDHARLFPDRLLYMVLENLLSYAVDKVVAVSEYSKQDLVKFEKISPKKILVVPNGIDFDLIDYDRDQLLRQFGLNVNGPIIGTVCRLTEQKGTRFLIDALPMVIEKQPNVKLIIVGDGVLRQDLERQVSHLGLQNHTVFCGYQKEVAKYINVMDLFVSSSVWEGMPLGLLEVMACGKPIVATTVGGVTEVVEEGVTGCLVPPEQPGALANAIVNALARPEELRAWGAAARARYESRFTGSIMLENYKQLFLNLAVK